MTTPEPILLIGAGAMAIEYSNVLSALGHPQLVLGRGSASAARFVEATGIAAGTGELGAQLDLLEHPPRTAIVAVNAMYLAEVTEQLAAAGVERILVEKPAALDAEEMAALVALTGETAADVRIGYNRRFLASVMKCREMIAEDDGVLSVKFDFSELPRRIDGLQKPRRELDTWFFGNSMHVVDLALHFAGDCVDVSAAIAASASWHPAAGVFVGHARARGGALVAWHANWVGPGRWGVEVTTAQRRLILQPLERLRVQAHDSFEERPVDLDLDLDTSFKPGLMRQVRAFLYGECDEFLPDLEEHARRWATYDAMRTGASLHGTPEP